MTESCAITKVKNSSIWARSSVEAREQMIQEAVNEVNRNRHIKREKGLQTWMEMHHKYGVDRDKAVNVCEFGRGRL